MKDTLRSIGKFSSALIAVLLLSVIGANCPPVLTVEDNYVLAYATGGNTINVRYANVLTSSDWHDGKFPSTIQTGQGVGLVADTNGLMHIVLTDGPNGASIQMIWGLGPSIWDNSGPSPSSSPLISSPVAVAIGGSRYLVAYQQAGATVFVGLYEHTNRRFLANVAPFDPLNTQVEGRPSIASSDGKVVLVWRRWNGQVYDLVAASGTVGQSGVIFNRPRLIATPGDANLQPGVQSDPAATRSGTSFFLIVVREQASAGGGLHGWRTQLFQSVDGDNWSSAGITASLDVHNQTYIGLTGSSDGNLLAAAMLRPPSGTAPTSVARYTSGQWQPLSSVEVHAMFNTRVAWKPFVLINNKH